jgi:hypothetical protein
MSNVIPFQRDAHPDRSFYARAWEPGDSGELILILRTRFGSQRYTATGAKSFSP